MRTIKKIYLMGNFNNARDIEMLNNTRGICNGRIILAQEIIKYLGEDDE